MPGVNVNITNVPVPAVRPTETGKLFVVGQLERGSTTKPIVVHSVSELEAKTGKARLGHTSVSSAEEFFTEGGSTLVVGRAVGSSVATAKVELKAGAETVLKVTAANGGEWGNELKVTIVTESAKFGIKIYFKGKVVIEKTGLETVAAAVEWAEQEAAEYVILKSEGTGVNPTATVEKALSGGVNETDTATTYVAALKLFTVDYGCGQVAAPGITDATTHEGLLEHGEKFARTPLIDYPLGATQAELESASAGLQKKEGARRSAGFSTWAIIPGTAPNTTRKVPWSAVQAGIIARNDASTKPPQVNEASAGFNGRPRNVVGLVTEFQQTERNELNTARVIAIRNSPALGIETYGNVTITEPALQPPWESLSAARLFMFVESEGEQILEKFVFEEIDPHGLLFQRVGAALQTFLETLGNQLYNPASEAVNVSGSVNTKETIKQKKLIAAIKVQPSPSAETVTLNISAESV